MSRGRMMVVRPPRGHRATDDVRPTPCVWIIHCVHLLPGGSRTDASRRRLLAVYRWERLPDLFCAIKRLGHRVTARRIRTSARQQETG